MRKIKFIEVPAEFGAGTRGASLGIQALKVASINKKSNLFLRFPSEEVPIPPKPLLIPPKNPFSKYSRTIANLISWVATAVERNLKEDYFPVILGGDHSYASGTVAGLKRFYQEKRVGVIWMDAHADIHTPYTTPSGNIHGMCVAIMMGFTNEDLRINEINDRSKQDWDKMLKAAGMVPMISPGDFVYVDVRDTESEERMVISRNNIKIFPPSEIKKLGVESVAEQTLAYLKDCDVLYVSFDVDALDESISKGTGTPAPDGLSIEEARRFLKIVLSDVRIACFEMVEINPLLDLKNRMAEVAFELLEDAVKVLAKESVGNPQPEVAELSVPKK